MRPGMKLSRWGVLFCVLIGFATQASAGVTVLLEEPYSYDGALAGIGHTAVYLTHVCAATPIHLRRCGPGERGVVISRYNRIAGYDWIAIPLIPYLYAVDKPEDVPLSANQKLVAFLRDQYRRAHLEELAPDTASGDAPKGDWVQLVGSSYNRTSYGFQIETTAAQDDALIQWLNSRPNRASYKVLSRNCADFVHEVVNFYYPKAISRRAITDLEVMTPKHAAKSLVKYSKHHPDLKFTRIVFPQVPGTMKRSKPVRGVLESVVRAKKYILPLAVFHPIVAGGVAGAYLFGDRFHPARNAVVFNIHGSPEAPPSDDERQSYREDLESEQNAHGDGDAKGDRASWREFQQKAQPQLDDSGRPVLAASYGGDEVEMGVTRQDLPRDDVPATLQRGLMLARLRQALSRSRSPRISGDELRNDWQLLQEIDSAEQENASRSEQAGNEIPEQSSN